MMPIHDLITSIASVVIAIAILVWTLRSATYFQEGLLAKTMHRIAVVSIFLFLHFLAIGMIEFGVLSQDTAVDDAFGILFMLALWYTIYSFAKDWRTLEDHAI